VIAAALRRVLDEHRVDASPGMPPEATVVSPPDLDAAADIMRAASASTTPVLFWGSGEHQGYGYAVDAPIVLSTSRLNRLVDWQADDLTVVVEAGFTVSRLEDLLADRRQSAVLPETPGDATVGGVIAAGVSGFRRLRYGPTRDRLLESVLVTGDGRLTTAGGRVVKNVTGFDIPRLATGSFGSLGLIGRVCLKLWPRATETALPVESAADALRLSYRPLAVLETNHGSWVYLTGTDEEIAGQAIDLGTTPDAAVDWPELPPTQWRATLRIPPAAVAAAVDRLRPIDGMSFIAAHGVGTVDIAATAGAAESFGGLRAWCESAGGAFVVSRRPSADAVFDPWGSPPPSHDLQRRVKAAFDPAGVANPGRLPGRI